MHNARAALGARARHGSLDRYVWRVADGRPIRNGWRRVDRGPARTPAPDALCANLRVHRFRSGGTTICYAFMQAVQMADDHVDSCFRRTAAGSLE